VHRTIGSAMVYTTLPGDLGTLDSQGMGEGMPIWRRFAVMCRARRIDLTEVMRGYDTVDRGFFEQGQFRRALCDCMGMQWTELAMTSAEFTELASPYYTKVPQVQGAPPPMVQWRHFARDMQKVADELLTDKDIAAAERLDGTNDADLMNTRNDGYYEARSDKGEKKGQDMSPDGKKLKVHQSAAALASGILEYEDVIDEDGDGIADKLAYTGERADGELSAASQIFGFDRARKGSSTRSAMGNMAAQSNGIIADNNAADGGGYKDGQGVGFEVGWNR